MRRQGVEGVGAMEVGRQHPNAAADDGWRRQTPPRCFGKNLDHAADACSRAYFMIFVPAVILFADREGKEKGIRGAFRGL